MRSIYLPPMLILATALAGCSPADDTEVFRGAEAAAIYEELTADDLAMVDDTLQAALSSFVEGEPIPWENPVSGNLRHDLRGKNFLCRSRCSMPRL